VPVVADSGGTAVEIGRATLAQLAATAALTAPGPGWVVLLDADFPGWEVTVDGRPARAARAYGLFRAVAVPAGAHTIAWSYRPASYALGLLCAAPALALAGLGIGLGGRPRGGFSGRTRR
jgi:hypothetical protein